MNEEELKALSRHRLQQEAKKLGIKANQSSSVLIQMILDSQSTNDKKEEEIDNVEQTEGILINNSIDSVNDLDKKRISNDSRILPSSETSVIVSENETNLVEDLNRILENESQTSMNISTMRSHSDIDTLTLQDILNRADTTFVAPNTSHLSDTRVSSDNTNQSRLPSISKNIISILIDMDNANYGKKEEEESIISSDVEKDPRLSQTVITGADPMNMEEDSLDIITSDIQEEITPNTCFEGYSDEQLSQLCKKYKDRVMQDGATEDMEILLNINTVLSDRLKYGNTYQTEETNSDIVVREGSLVVNNRSSISASDAVKQDSWEKNIGLVEGMDVDDTTDIQPIINPTYDEPEVELPPASPVEQMDSSEPHLPVPAAPFRSRNRKTIISAYRLNEIREGINLDAEESDHSQTDDSIDIQGESPEEYKDEEAQEAFEGQEESEASVKDFVTEEAPAEKPDPKDCTYLQLDVNLDKPISIVNTEAQNRFYSYLKESVNHTIQEVKTKPFFMELVNMLRPKKIDRRRDSLNRLIDSNIEKAKRTCITNHDSISDVENPEC